ncbi:unnamed protein product [Didymodactylos carnosus]|uniref:Uncharacterized protein n=1 Tax=Didymodactylos carnosus TaxID=1234261 RepID=A0A814FTU9_9BILA|nr:unnamed protein product [Didymodactylos carnosus]CAF0987198.1 unnamed protein product [Didymodactylos carnosus]CAF3654574.1 unnamed protein product [Didymodactylos carnosus]CAF3759362.1 unnamed protein product [Didymodactylos carnosus]
MSVTSHTSSRNSQYQQLKNNILKISSAKNKPFANETYSRSNSSEYEYVGRLITRERPILRLHDQQQLHQRERNCPNNTSILKLLLDYNNLLAKSYGNNELITTRSVKGIQRFQQTLKQPRLNAYPKFKQEDHNSYNDNGKIDYDQQLGKPISVTRISDGHYREIYRLPTPPPKLKRIIHRLKPSEPKLIEQIYVRRSPQEIIENVIEVPSQHVRVVNKGKFLDGSPAITQSKPIRLHSNRHNHRKMVKNKEFDGELASSLQSINLAPQQLMTNTVFPTNQLHTGYSTNFTQFQQPQMFTGQQQTPTFIQTTIPPHMFNAQQTQPHTQFQQQTQHTCIHHQQQPQIISHLQQQQQQQQQDPPILNLNTLSHQSMSVPQQQQNPVHITQQPQMTFFNM